LATLCPVNRGVASIAIGKRREKKTNDVENATKTETETETEIEIETQRENADI
jgi:hypothetical protein